MKEESRGAKNPLLFSLRFSLRFSLSPIYPRFSPLILPFQNICKNSTNFAKKRPIYSNLAPFFEFFVIQISPTALVKALKLSHFRAFSFYPAGRPDEKSTQPLFNKPFSADLC